MLSLVRKFPFIISAYPVGSSSPLAICGKAPCLLKCIPNALTPACATVLTPKLYNLLLLKLGKEFGASNLTLLLCRPICLAINAGPLNTSIPNLLNLTISVAE